VTWSIEFVDEFAGEVKAMSDEVRRELLAHARLLEERGPLLKRPHADTLNGSAHVNMKELRFKATGGVWRVAFAFDLERRGILLVAGDKSGRNESRFYKRLIAIADKRFDEHLARLKKKGKKT